MALAIVVYVICAGLVGGAAAWSFHRRSRYTPDLEDVMFAAVVVGAFWPVAVLGYLGYSLTNEIARALAATEDG
jgi:hypothetical protein